MKYSDIYNRPINLDLLSFAPPPRLLTSWQTKRLGACFTICMKEDSSPLKRHRELTENGFDVVRKEEPRIQWFKLRLENISSYRYL